MSAGTVSIEVPQELAEWALATIRGTVDKQDQWRREHILEAHDWASINAHHLQTLKLADAIAAGLAVPGKVAA